MRKSIPYVGLIAFVVLCLGTLAAGGGDAQESRSSATPQKEKKLIQGEKEAKKMLLLMDKDMNGKVSKQEFMGFMEVEFERLDINHDDELDVKELTESRVLIRTRAR